jgi:hypothetical protein
VWTWQQAKPRGWWQVGLSQSFCRKSGFIHFQIKKIQGRQRANLREEDADPYPACRMTFLIFIAMSDGSTAAASDQINDNHNQRHHQKKMNQSSANIPDQA